MNQKLPDQVIEQIVAEYLQRKQQSLPIKPMLDSYKISRQNLQQWVPKFADKLKQTKRKDIQPKVIQPVVAMKVNSAWPQEAVDAVTELKAVIRYLEKRISEYETSRSTDGFRSLTNPH